MEFRILHDFLGTNKIPNCVLINILNHPNNLNKTIFSRYEIIGDSFLRFCVLKMLMLIYPNYTSGNLTPILSYIVSKEVLAEIIFNNEIEKYCLIHRTFTSKNTTKVYCDILEAFIGAILEYAGEDNAKYFIEKKFSIYLNISDNKNFKGIIKEFLDALGIKYEYIVLTKYGEYENPYFVVVLMIFFNITKKYYGIGLNIKQAEKMAAKNAIFNIFQNIPKILT